MHVIWWFTHSKNNNKNIKTSNKCFKCITLIKTINKLNNCPKKIEGAIEETDELFFGCHILTVLIFLYSTLR